MRIAKGFTLIEILIALTLGLLVISVVFELFLANQRSLKTQIALSTLESRLHRITDILRADIHHAAGKVKVLENQLYVNDHVYLTEKNALIMIDANHRKSRIVEEVNNMRIIQHASAIEIWLQVASGSLRETLHVITTLK
jgi:prepilin-type N-terminal cleavage/methylation domain-containing protein